MVRFKLTIPASVLVQMADGQAPQRDLAQPQNRRRHHRWSAAPEHQSHQAAWAEQEALLGFNA